MTKFLAAGIILLATSFPVFAQGAPSPDVLKDLAPTGKLRAAINFGNGVLAQKGPNGEPRGVTPELATALAKRLGVPVEFVIYPAAGQVAAGAKQNAWDIGFIAIEPARAAEIDFTAPYVLIEGTYLVRKDSPLKDVADVDKPGIKIGVGLGSVYDLYLTRTLKNATLVRNPKGGAVGGIEPFVNDRLDAAAGVREPLDAYAKDHPGGAGDGRPIRGNPSGDRHTEGAYGRRGLSARLRRRDEGERLRRRRAQALRPDRAGRAAGKLSDARHMRGARRPHRAINSAHGDGGKPSPRGKCP